MSSATDAAAPAPSTTRRQNDEEITWTKTKDEKGHHQWWKSGSNHVNGSYTTLYVKCMASHWVVTVKSVNAYGLTESAKTIQRTRRDQPDAEDRVLERAREYMMKHPAERPFVGKPSLPDDVGNWSLVREDTREWSWTAGEHRLDVDHSGFTNTGGSRHHLVYRHGGDERRILEDTVTVRAIRSAERCMVTTPSGKIGAPEIIGELETIPGIGPSKALDLQLLGIPNVSALDATLHAGENQIDYELREALNRLLTTRTLDHFGASPPTVRS